MFDNYGQGLLKVRINEFTIIMYFLGVKKYSSHAYKTGFKVLLMGSFPNLCQAPPSFLYGESRVMRWNNNVHSQPLVEVTCLAQEHNAVPPARTQTWIARQM